MRQNEQSNIRPAVLLDPNMLESFYCFQTSVETEWNQVSSNLTVVSTLTPIWHFYREKKTMRLKLQRWRTNQKKPLKKWLIEKKTIPCFLDLWLNIATPPEGISHLQHSKRQPLPKVLLCFRTQPAAVSSWALPTSNKKEHERKPIHVSNRICHLIARRATQENLPTAKPPAKIRSI